MDKKLKISLLLDFYGELLSDKQRVITENYYNNDFSLSEIADNLGITRQGVYDNVKRTENLLLEMEEKIGLYKRFELMQNALDDISSKATTIINENKSLDNINISIEKNASDILQIVSSLKE